MASLIESLFSIYNQSLLKPQPSMGAKVEADLSRTLEWQRGNNDSIKTYTGLDLNITALYVYAVMKCLTEFPEANCKVVDGEIVPLESTNIGLLTSLGDRGQDGGLITIRKTESTCVEHIVVNIENARKRLNNTFNSDQTLSPELVERLRKISGKVMYQPSIIINTLSLYGVEIDRPFLPEGMGFVLTFGSVKSVLRQVGEKVKPIKTINIYGTYNPLMGSGITAMRFMGNLRRIIEKAEYTSISRGNKK